MSADIAILVPVLRRPQNAAPLVESIEAATEVSVRILFLCSPGDDQGIEAARATGCELDIMSWEPGPGDYAKKINYGIDTTPEEWVFQAADDLLFHQGWDVEALKYAERPSVGLIGTNDMGNGLVKAGRHATHSLIRRTYVEEFGTIDEPGKALHEGYDHCWVDNELVETARSRNAFASARRSRVEHLHYIWHKGEDDATYQKGQRHYRQDAKLFHERRPLWRGRRR